jgi:quercetin dioxygenase-like cupin family protein
LRGTPSDSWSTGWTAADPPSIGHSAVQGGAWYVAGGIREHLAFADSGLAAATGGLLGAQYVRFTGSGAGDSGWHCHDLDWQFWYVLRGSMVQENAELGTTVLSAGDSGYYPGFLWHREYGFSDDCELIALRVPAVTRTFTGRGTPLPERAGRLDPRRRPVFSLDLPEAYVPVDGGPFEARDLGTVEPTAGRIRMRIVRARGPGRGATRHVHTAAKWFVVLGGAATIAIDSAPPRELGYLDAISIGAGVPHALGPFTAGFSVLELAIPALHETVRRC